MDQLVSPSAKEWIAWFTHFSVPAVILIGIAVFIAGARSGKYIQKCILAPAIALAGIFTMLLGLALAEKFPKERLLENGCRGVSIAILVLALVCAVWGLVEYFKQHRHSSKRAGARYAVITAALCALSLAAIALSVYTKRTYGQGNFFKVLGQPVRICLLDEGFQISPSDEWIRVDGSQLKPTPSLAFTHLHPPLSFSLVVQKPGPNTPHKIEDLVHLAQTQVLANSSSAKFTKPAILSDSNGSTAVFETQVSQTVFSFYYVHRLVLSRGFAYQLITWGPANDPTSVRLGSESMFASFAVLR